MSALLVRFQFLVDRTEQRVLDQAFAAAREAGDLSAEAETFIQRGWTLGQLDRAKVRAEPRAGPVPADDVHLLEADQPAGDTGHL